MTASLQASPRATITAWSAVSPFGIGRDSFVDGFRTGRETAVTPDPGQWSVGGDPAHLVPGFNVREVLGKKGTRSMDRATGLAVATVGQLLGRPDAAQPAEVMEHAALVLGTTAGSVQSIASFTRDSLVSDKPYLVDPAQFPNAVMNCAAGTSAIWHRLRGPNATIAAGRVSGLHALRYSLRLLAGNRAPAVLCGAVEEFSDTRYWVERHSRGTDEGGAATVLGEGCAVLQVDPVPSGQDRQGLAEVLAVEFGVHSGDPTEVLTACLRRAMGSAAVDPADVWALSPSRPAGELGRYEEAVLGQVFGDTAARRVPTLFGDTAAASVLFQIVATLALAESEPGSAGRVAVVTSVDRDGEVGCALLRLG